MTHLPPPQAVIFDWDGTLVDTIPGLRVAHNHVRTFLGHEPWTEAQFHQNLKHSSRELYPTLYGERSAEALAILYRFIEEHHLSYLNILPGAPDLLDFLARRGVPVGIVSNKLHNYLQKEIGHLGWQDRFYCAIGAGKAAKDKPAADPVNLALSLAASPLDPARTWFVGDTETDMLAARASGCHAVLITHGHDRKHLIDQYNPAIVTEDCHHFISVLERVLVAKNENKA